MATGWQYPAATCRARLALYVVPEAQKEMGLYESSPNSGVVLMGFVVATIAANDAATRRRAFAPTIKFNFIHLTSPPPQ